MSKTLQGHRTKLNKTTNKRTEAPTVNSHGQTTVGFDQRSCATSDPVSTRMGDRLWTGKPSRYVTSQLGRLSLLPSVGR